MSLIFEKISSLSHSIVILYFFALITEEGFLISPCYSLELCIQWVYLSFCPLLLAFLLSVMCKAFLDKHFALKIRDTRGTFHAKMGSIKDRNGMNLKEYKILRSGKNTQKNYTKKSFMTQITTMV